MWNPCSAGGRAALVAARDDDGRTGLHFACGVGSIECVNAILGAGAEVDAADKDAFTPLHMLLGSCTRRSSSLFVRAGANPELQDSTGRSPLDLVETLKFNTPATTVTFARRSVLESIAKTLEKFVFEEVPPTHPRRASRRTETGRSSSSSGSTSSSRSGWGSAT